MAGEITPTPFHRGIAQAGAHSEGVPVHPKRRADVSRANYSWQEKRMPSPGAMAYAFETMGLAEFTPIGAGVRQRRTFNVLQPPQLYSGNAVVTNGLGGLVAGQVIFQPLLDPYSGNYGGA